MGLLVSLVPPRDLPLTRELSYSQKKGGIARAGSEHCVLRGCEQRLDEHLLGVSCL